MRTFQVLLFCGLSVFASALWAEGPSSSRYDEAIAAFEAADKENPPPEDVILFIGSSSIRGWRTLAEDFPEYPVINRGFGGAWVHDTIHYADRIVLPYKPSTIIFYAGENDLRGGFSAERVVESFKEFVEIVHDELPETRIAYVSMKPSPSRARLIDEMRKGNEAIRDWARETENVDYIDVFNPMLDKEGQAREELFVKDKLHLNSAGYRLWRKIIGPYLMSVQ
ncbi:MAG TPA: SGNH/GDSL hydrolase family protein [Opitutales bacterium]|nr:SGNH/GDSL hydrolase family protein [Opitutales bacterium]